jgi:hypothetical protein
MKKASEYRAHAAECRTLAAMPSPEHCAMLLKMAETWKTLANDREEQIARKERIEALDGNDGGS